ncbi:MAG: NADH-quinone oxidoreductase subunit C [Mailhella sp.]|nr:NADH-quinone oxidoreductase subunit C [Mailhella sp.]
MMFHYKESIEYAALPLLSMEELTASVVRFCRGDWRIAAFFGLNGENGPEALCILASTSGNRMLEALRSPLPRRWESITPDCPQAHLFERELAEIWGVQPQGHPWMKPVRYCPADASDERSSRPGPAETSYYRIEGAEVHEVAVGPVHAGVIEPGHFRFQCYGENVMHLEIQLGFQHRDVEHLILNSPDNLVLPLMENIAGDTAIGHATAYCTVAERLAGVEITTRAHLMRRLALELERLANHTRDLGAIGGDTGFLPTASWNGRITGDWLNITSELCGSRFGRNLLCPGGVKWDVDSELALKLVARTRSSYRDTRGSVDVMLESSSVMARLTDTGVVSEQAARDLGLVGMVARACGVDMDCRFDFPLSDLPNKALHKRVQHSGDVLARTLVRSDEVDDSAASVEADLQHLSYTSGSEPCRVSMPKLPGGRLAVALVEGWRGEVCHVGITSADGGWAAYKVVDPSFHNWTGLAMALRGEQISDFPLCNKSFNLSYCGHDL